MPDAVGSFPDLPPGLGAPNTPRERAHVLASLRRRGLGDSELPAMLELVPVPVAVEDEPAPDPVAARRYPPLRAGLVDVAGTCRRLRHLMLQRWSVSNLAGRIGVSPATVRAIVVGEQRGVSPQLAAAVRRTFAALRDVEGPWRSRRSSERRGWVRVEAYQDVDDPACVPRPHVVQAVAS